MVSPVQTGVQFAAPKKMSQPRFQGQKEYEQFKKELESFPAHSLEKLDEIKNIQGPRHIRVARDYAKTDPNVRKINKYIDTFINQRQQDARQQKEASYLSRLTAGVSKFLGLTTPKPSGEELLADLRKAIGEVLDHFNANKDH